MNCEPYRDLLPWLYDQVTLSLREYFNEYNFYHYPVDERSAHVRFPCIEVGQINLEGTYFCQGGALISFVIEIGISDRFPKKEMEKKREGYIETIGGFMDEFDRKDFYFAAHRKYQGKFVPSSVRMNATDANTYVILTTTFDYTIEFVRQPEVY